NAVEGQEGLGMSDESSSAVTDEARHWATMHRDLYLGSGGVEGHIMDLSAMGGHSLGTHCLIKYKGRKSGNTFITPLCYSVIGGEVVVVGSKGGADQHPDWYFNIRASTELEFQIASQGFRATWREPEGAEREHIWKLMVGNYPFYETYQAST